MKNKDITLTEKARQDLWTDYLNLAEKYDKLMPGYEFGFALIQFTVKMLMDIAPRHGVAIETIRAATEQGISWHVEEKKAQSNHD